MARREATPEQKQAAAERRERFRALAKQVAEWPEEQRAALVDRCGAVVTCEGRALSFVNTCLVLTQRPGASMVGGFAQWLKAGRCVRKGETGIGIWVPIAKEKPGEKAEPATHAEAAGGTDGGRPRFIMGTVFDVSQTNPLPDGSDSTGGSGGDDGEPLGRPKFDLGATVATPGALAALEASGQGPAFFLDRHVFGDWGSVGDDDGRLNDAALKDGGRLLSVYRTLKGANIWVLTEAADDRGRRAATTILLPDEY